THIGFGSPNKQDSAAAHGAPLGEEEVRLTKEALNWPVDKKFFIPEDVRNHFEKALEKGEQNYQNWQETCEDYKNEYSDEFDDFQLQLDGSLPEDIDQYLPHFDADDNGMATRNA